MKTIVYLVVCFCFFGLHAQDALLTKANRKFEGLDFIEASKIYLRIAESGYESEELFRKLGDIYYFKSKYTEAKKWYEKLYGVSGANMGSDYLLRYAQTLKASGHIEKGTQLYNAFLSVAGISNEKFSSSSDYLDIIAENSDRYVIEELSINTEGIDYGAFVKNNVLYFSSSRNLGRKKRIDTWSGKPFLDIYAVSFNKDEKTFDTPQTIKGKINTKFHESSPVITKDGNTMYFTRSNTTSNSRAGKNSNQNLKIYRAKRINGKWDTTEDLSINSEVYSNAHPALSPDEKVLYFVSDMPGSYGATDLFKVKIHEDGTLGTPENMGPLINTQGRESFPFVTNTNELYFSSDGHLGLGGYDVFYTDLKNAKKELLNVGKPVNSPHDDYAFFINDSTRYGYFSSNRTGTDNIYSLQETAPIKSLLNIAIRGTVTNRKTGEPIEGVLVALIGENDEPLSVVETDIAGKYTMDMDSSASNRVKLQKEGFTTTGRFIEQMDNFDKVDFEMDETRIELGELLNFEVVYFDLNSSYLRETAKTELDNMIAFLMANPTITIRVNSYADSRGTKKYNKWLSARRTQRILDYLVNGGIDPKRLEGDSYGEENLVNDCADGKNCDEELHQLNRRTEFIVTNRLDR